MKLVILVIILLLLILTLKTKENFISKPNKKYTIIYTIPKSGTHLVSDIISLMIDPNVNIYNKKDMYNVIPHRPLEFKQMNKVLKNNIFSQHTGSLNKNYIKNSHLILTIRNPIDICISRYYFYEKRNPNSKIILKDYIKKIINKTTKQCIDQINLSKSHDSNIILRFEDIVSKKKETTIKIFNFIKPFLKLDKVDLDLILKKTSFREVQNKEKKNGYKVGAKQPFMFHRNGKIRQWEKELTKQEYNEILDLIPLSLKTYYSDIFI